MNKYAEALEIVPRTLAENAGLHVTEVLSALHATHMAGTGAAIGIDIDGGSNSTGMRDAAAADILDSLVVKAQALRLASETAITVLKVDQIIMSKQAGGPKPRQPGAPDED
jgi:T-complex protein 1 subunit theta